MMNEKRVFSNDFADLIDKRDEKNLLLDAIHLSISNMAPIYQDILCLEGEGFGYQPVIVTEYPAWINEEDHSEPQLIFQCGSNMARGLIMIKESDTVYEDFHDGVAGIMCKSRKIQGYLVNDNFFSRVEIDLMFPDDKLHFLYRQMAKIAKELNVPVLAVLVFSQKHMGKRDGDLFGYEDPEEGRADLMIRLKSGSKMSMLHSLAHEMRHVWQHNRNVSWAFDNPFDLLDKSFSDYVFAPKEIDADAYATKYLGSMGQDGEKFCLGYRLPHDQKIKCMSLLACRIQEIRKELNAAA